MDTIAGFILNHIGTIPEEGENTVLEYDQFTFTVQTIKDNR